MISRRSPVPQLLFTSTLIVFVVMVVVVVAGCSKPSGPPRYSIEGAVTFEGKPVPAGQVTFEPDHAQGNRGPASYARIVAGRYSSSAGKGTVGGAHRVTVQGFNGQSSPEMAAGGELFPVFSTEIDLPREDHIWDIEVPATAE